MKRCAAVERDPGPASDARRATLIVRMWTEPAQPDRRVWRGTVEHVQRGERCAVADVERLLELLALWLSAEAE